MRISRLPHLTFAIFGIAMLWLAGCTSTPAPEPDPLSPEGLILQAKGITPPWTLKITGTTLSWDGAGVQLQTFPRMQASALGHRYAGQSDNHALEVWFQDRACHLEAGTQPYPNDVQVRVDNDRLQGCGGNPATLLQRTWKLVGGAAAAATELQFDPYYRLHVRTGCSHYTTRYIVTPESLQLAPIGDPSSSCTGDDLSADAALLKLLAGVTRFDIGMQGKLQLLQGERVVLESLAP